MFLNELNKSEGIIFLQLVKALANVDNCFEKEEQELYKDYLDELKIKDEEVQDSDLDKIYNELSASSERVKNIIYFELVGLALVDGEYEDEEVDFLEVVGEKLNIPRYKKISFANYFYNFVDIYKFSTVDAESKVKLLREQAEKLLA